MTSIETNAAPAAIGPYSQAIMLGDWLFASGQIPLDAETGQMVDGDVIAHTRQCLRNIDAILAAAGLERTDVVKTTVFVCDLGDFEQINEEYARFFGGHRPARSTVGVAALPRGATVEIEMIAARRRAKGGRDGGAG